jgi:hypothetical protein
MLMLTGLFPAILSSAVAMGQTVLYVDDDAPAGGDGASWTTAFHDLQLALEDAASGGVDEIRVAQGTYAPTSAPQGSFQLIDDTALLGGYAGLGAADPDERDIDAYETVLSGLNQYRVLFGSGTGPTAVLDGFTITKGRRVGVADPSRSGAGMHNDGGSPTVSRCIFLNNWCGWYGGAVYNRNSSHPAFTDCQFVGNYSDNRGGAMYNDTGSGVTMTRCKIMDNTAWDSGGAVYCRHGEESVFQHCTFATNSAAAGGALYFEESDSVLIDCTLNGNQALWSNGGAIVLSGGVSQILNCGFYGNSAGNGSGGAISHSHGIPMMTNCAFSGNLANLRGAIALSGGASLINCTITGNHANSYGGIGAESGPLTLFNCILWGNSSAAGMSESAQFYKTGGTVDISHCCIQSWTGAWPSTAVISEDPRFEDADGPDDTIGTPDDNLHLIPSSTSIDFGDNDALPADTYDLDGDGDTAERLPIDLGGDPRVQANPCRPDEPAIVDLGAFESDAFNEADTDADGVINCEDDCPLHYDPDQTDCDHDGHGDVCAVAFGLVPDCNDNGVPDSCDIVGGTSDDSGSDGVPDECQGLYFVDDDAPEGGDGRSWDTAYKYLQDVLFDVRPNSEIRVAMGNYRPDQGEHGQVTPGASSATFRLANEVTLLGGYAGRGQPDPDLRDPATFETVLDGNLAATNVVTLSDTDQTAILDGFTVTRGRDRGLNNLRGSPQVSNCTMTRNGDSGMYNNGDPVLRNCNFSENFGDYLGGAGLTNETGGQPLLIDCVFSDNMVTSQGGAIRNSGSMRLRRCTFLRNVAAGGGAISNVGSLDAVNCLFLGNVAEEWDFTGYGGAIFSSDNLTLTGCVFVGNEVPRYVLGRYPARGGAVYALNATITHCTFAANVCSSPNPHEAEGGAIYGSAEIHNCVLWGNTPDQLLSSGLWTVRYSDVQGGWEGEGNIDVDPLWVRMPSPGPDGQWGTDDDDYGDLRLRPGSPVIDAADNRDVPADTLDVDEDGDAAEPLPLDAAGRPRFSDDPATEDTGIESPDFPELAVVDMGAYEFDNCEDPCESAAACPDADVNCDGVVDGFDVGIIRNTANWLQGVCVAAQHRADVNDDGTVDGFDIAAVRSTACWLK